MGRAIHNGLKATDDGFPAALAVWLARDGALLDALVVLRRLGAEGGEALRAVLGIRRLAELRASWGLWEALVEGDGGDSETLLLGTVPLSVLENARRALFGPSWRQAG